MHASGWPGGWGCSLSQDGASRVMHAPACHRLGPCDLVGHHPALQEGSKPYPQRTRDKVSSCMQHQAWPSALIAVLCAVIRYRIAHAGSQTKYILHSSKIYQAGVLLQHPVHAVHETKFLQIPTCLFTSSPCCVYAALPHMCSCRHATACGNHNASRGVLTLRLVLQTCRRRCGRS